MRIQIVKDEKNAFIVILDGKKVEYCKSLKIAHKKVYAIKTGKVTYETKRNNN